jgi:hypothetical protein
MNLRGANFGFHAGGAEELSRTIENDPLERARREAQRRRRIETLLASRADEFRVLGYWRKQDLLRSIHLRVDKEFSLSYCLF